MVRPTATFKGERSMHEYPLHGPTFTLRQLLVLILMLCGALALFVPLIQRSREEARRVQCVNNLKQLGLGHQNFHDIRKEICPAYLTNDNSPTGRPQNYATWPVLVLPFMEAPRRNPVPARRRQRAGRQQQHLEPRSAAPRQPQRYARRPVPKVGRTILSVAGHRRTGLSVLREEFAPEGLRPLARGAAPGT